MGRVHETSFLAGGPVFRLQKGIEQRKAHWSAGSAAVAFAWITWVPLLVMAVFRGSLAVESFLRDTSIHLRLLVAGPLAIVCEPTIGRTLGRVSRQFLSSGIVRHDEVLKFQKILSQIRNSRDSAGIEVGLLLFVYAVNVAQAQLASLSWYSPASWSALSPHSWYWFAWFDRPVLQFLLVRWVWRLVLWSVFLWRTSRLELTLSASHADRAGGLGFLAVAYADCSWVAFVFSMMWTAGWHDLISHGTSTALLRTSLPVFAAVLMALFLGPYLVFTPALMHLRRTSVLDYDRLCLAYCRMFEERWIATSRPLDESQLAEADFRDFADMLSTGQAVRDMKPFPIDRPSLVVLALGTFVPMLPLLDLFMPIPEIIRRALGPIW